MAITGNYRFLGTLQHGLLAFPAWRAGGSIFAGYTPTVQGAAFTAGLTTAYTSGAILYNPTTSNSNLSILRASYAFVLAVGADSTIGLGVAHSTTAITTPGTALSVVCTQVGSANTPQGMLYSPTSATLPVAPKLAKILGSVTTAAVTTSPTGASANVNVDGEILLLPGSYCVFTSSGAGTDASFFGGFSWEEIPVGTQ